MGADSCIIGHGIFGYALSIDGDPCGFNASSTAFDALRRARNEVIDDIKGCVEIEHHLEGVVPER
jgi:hypothetical protein